MGRRKKQVPGWAARVMGALLGCAQPGCAVLAIFLLLTDPSSERE